MSRASSVRRAVYSLCNIKGLLVLWLGLGLLSTALHAAPPTIADLKVAQEKSRAAAERVVAATVGIINAELAGPGTLGQGSGVVVQEDGLILTVGHVLSKADSELTVVFSDGRRAKAKCLGADRSLDAGMAKIVTPGKWPHVEMGRSAELKPGQWCMAVGHPGGVQQGRTPPVRLGRVLVAGSGKNIADGITTDATVIAGDSGGPLFDLEGRVIGIHSSIGPAVTQNRHVPVDIYRAKWDDLVAGKQTGALPSGMAHDGKMPDVAKFRRLLHERLAARDPEVMEMAKGGRMALTPEKMNELMAKWEKKQAADGNAIDFLQFQRLFQEHLIAGDPEVRKWIKDGKMMLTFAQMQELLAAWDKKPAADAPKPKEAGDPAATKPKKDRPARPKEDKTAGAPPQAGKPVKPEDLAELLKNAKPDGHGAFRLEVQPDNADNVLRLLRKLGGMVLGGDARAGKGGPELLAALGPVAAPAAASTVVVLRDGKPAALGTVVRGDGCILTKASELGDKAACKIGDRELPAKVVGTSAEHDLALLKVDAKDLKPIAWSQSGPLGVGTWLVTPDAAGKAVAMGMVGTAARRIPKNPVIAMKNKAAMGIQLEPTAANAKIHAVFPGSPAEKAGLKPGDVITALGGRPTATPAQVMEQTGKYAPGDKVAIDVERDGHKLTMTLVLMPSEQMASSMGGASSSKVDMLSRMGGSMSKRHSDFPMAFTHDTVLAAGQCGGPVLDLDGRAVGLNIARADRTATYAIPAEPLRKVVEELLRNVAK